MTQDNKHNKHLPKVRSAKQIEASRRNGAKSKGAVTARRQKEGRDECLKTRTSILAIFSGGGVVRGV